MDQKEIKPKKIGSWVIRESKGDNYHHFHLSLRGGNHHIIGTCNKEFKTIAEAYAHINKARLAAPDTLNYRLERSEKGDHPYFNLVIIKPEEPVEIILTSEMYTSHNSRYVGIKSVMRNIFTTNIVEKLLSAA